ncbi:MAG: hypothetical protein ACK5JT_19260 [Hyphomicrobiaceae bacterium]
MSLKATVAALAFAGVGFFCSGASAAPVSPSATAAAAEKLPVDTVQYYYKKRQYCWYWDGWHGPGWYWCGYQMRRGHGWGGPAGWNKWNSPHRDRRDHRDRGPPRRHDQRDHRDHRR